MPALDWAAHHRLWVLGMGVTILVAAVAAGFWFFALRSPGTQIDLRHALRLYRQTQQATGSGDSPHLPPSGVYRYWTSGGEQLSLGGISRSFPAVTQMIVNESNCATVRWEPFEEHVEGLVECPVAHHGLVMTSALSDEQIAGIRTAEVIRCPTSAYLVPPNPTTGERWDAVCHAPSQRVGLAGEIVGMSSVRVGRRSVPALHTRLTLSFSGSELGANPTDYWISPQDGLILRQRETVDVAQQAGPLGAVRFTERMAIALASVTPAR
jgi:hypothetical protein